jgi:nucleotide-binding universal stress UspA family protein
VTQKIIVGFDGTDQAGDALQLAGALAAALGARLIVASAIEYGPEPLLGPAGYEGYDEARAAHYERVFEQARTELGELEFEARELQDTAAHGLNDLAEHERADLIVIGSTHHGSFGRVLAGTVASRLLHGAPCAVLVAPRGWSRGERTAIGLVGVGYDGSDEARGALTVASELASALGARLRVITVAPLIGPHEEHAAIEASRPAWAEILAQGVEAIGETVETEPVLSQGREPTELALQGVELDLLVVGSRAYGPLRRTLLGSVSAELVRTAPCPVLVVPRGAGTGGG